MADDTKEVTDEAVEEEEIGDDQTFDAAYVRKLRREAAGFRTKLRAYEQPFKGFSDVEREYLLGLVEELDSEPELGALKLRDLSKQLLEEKFYEGLDVPQKEIENMSDDKDKAAPSGGGEAMFTRKDLEEMFAQRDAAAQEAAAKAADDAEVEAILKEVEAAGFERGSEGFLTALSLANTQVQLGKEVDFKVLAPKVHALIGDVGEVSSDEAAPADLGDGEVAADNRFPKTATAGGSGSATEPARDWVAEAREAGKDVMAEARQRMEARLEQTQA